jgi:benzil reductase ((S)-benzoin forming)
MRTAIVTGVSRGLGEALVSELLAQGWHVVGFARTAPDRAAHAAYRFVRCDLGESATLADIARPAFERVAAERPDAVCLINNAATIAGVGVLGALQPADIATSLGVNLVAPTVLSNLFCAVFDDDSVERRIINVSSGAAQSTLAGESLYCVAKAGLEMLTRSLAAEHTSGRFRAITVRPGIIDTAMQTFARTQSKSTLPSVDLFKEFHASGRLVPPDVVARKIVERLVVAPVEHGRTYSYAEL